MQKRLWRIVRIHCKRLILLRGDRRAIARGIALGVAANFIPTVGIGPPLVYWIAGTIKGHKVAAVISTIGVKATIPLLYFMNYVIGELLLERRLTLSLKLSWNLSWIMESWSEFFSRNGN